MCLVPFQANVKGTEADTLTVEVIVANTIPTKYDSLLFLGQCEGTQS